MLKLIFFPVSLCFSLGLVEYNPGINYGQIFRDYSGNGIDAVNGESQYNTDYDTIPTDRGAFFTESGSIISLPPNDYISSFLTITPLFSVVAWVNLQASDGFLFEAEDGQNTIQLEILSEGPDNFFLTIGSPSGYQCILNGQVTFGKVYIGTWNLIVTAFTLESVIIYVNTYQQLYMLLTTQYTGDGAFHWQIGGFMSISGFMYSFSILPYTTDGSSYISFTQSYSCITGEGSCVLPCCPSIIVLDETTTCISTQSNPYLNAAGQACPSSSTGCSGSTSLICSCETPSCILQNQQNVCACSSSAYATPTECISCEESCASCQESLLCLTCISSNASPNPVQGCDCSPGFYGATPLIHPTSCMSCYTECALCTGPLICSTCVAANSLPSATQGCSCIPGFYGASPLITADACAACFGQCKTCSGPSICLSCIAANASPCATEGCSCSPGFFESGPLTTSDACAACFQECASCVGPGPCSTCIAANSVPDADEGCNCRSGFFGVKPLITAGACSCFEECAVCTSALVCQTCIASNASPNLTQGCCCDAGFYGEHPLVTAGACLACYEECATCAGPSLCLTCVAANAAAGLVIGCECKSGFYGSRPLVSSDSCSACYSECATCADSAVCVTCVAENAKPGLVEGCYCSPGFYGANPLTSSDSCTACYEECAACSGPSLCLTCIASSSSPDPVQGCNCLSGFFGVKPLTTVDACSCDQECEVCVSALLCASCIAINASPDAVQGCNCNSGLYGTKPLITAEACLGCYQECSTCVQALLCTACVSPNSSPSAVQGCECNTGFYGMSPLVFSDSCTACYEECASCSGPLLCLSCVSANASPDSLQGCNCNSGFYNTSSLTSSDSCIKCFEECETCTGPEVCVTCIASNATPDPVQGCNCNGDFAGVKPLVTANACSCNPECLSCAGPGICLTCIATMAAPDAVQGCDCNSGFYGVKPLITANACSACYEECATCSEYSTCVTCIATNSSPNIQTGIGCVCSTGYQGISPLISQSSCTGCYSECATCTDSNLCLTCVSSFATPVPTREGCVCNPKYWGTAPLTSQTSCKACAPDCAVCGYLGCYQCVASNAYPYLYGTCMCNLGYYQVAAMTESSACAACHPDCMICNGYPACVYCKSLSGQPAPDGIGCVCDTGYWNSNLNGSPISCYPCTVNTSVCDNTVAWSTTEITYQEACMLCSGECDTYSDNKSCQYCVDTNSAVDSSGKCVCNTYYYNAAAVAPLVRCNLCNFDCKTCDDPSNCVTCTDPNAYPYNSMGTGCTCNEGYWYDFLTYPSCQQCNADCKTCNQGSLCLTCINSEASPTNTSGCACNAGFWGTSPLSSVDSCLECNSECLTCSLYASCLTCSDPNAVPNLVTGTLCVCSDRYWNSNPSPPLVACVPCEADCATCLGPGVCTTCMATYAEALDQGCGCLGGYWPAMAPLNETNACMPCNSECAVCADGTHCLTCVDPNALVESSGGCSCKTGWGGVHPLSTSTSCVLCDTSCASCETTSSCVTCVDPNASPSAAADLWCLCNAKFWGTSPLNFIGACMPCNVDCADCSAESSCNACTDLNASAEDSSITGCVCNSGYWNSAAVGLAVVCESCNSECSECVNSVNCTSCVDSNASPSASGAGCMCHSGFFASVAVLSLDGSCVACADECSICSSGSACLSCQSLNASPSLSAGGLCACNEGYWGVSPLISSSSCTACDSECATCASASACLTCISQNAIAVSNAFCACAAGYWGIPPLCTASSCQACTGDCATCSTSASACIYCKDANSLPNSSTGAGCVCNKGYWNSNTAGNTVTCAPCSSECSVCGDGGLCEQCVDYHASPDSGGIGCSCIEGYWGVHPLNTVSSCLLCTSECEECSSTGACITCKDPNASPSPASGSLCACNAGFWGVTPLTTSTSCSACSAECVTCTSASSCLTCVSSEATPSSSDFCVCNPGYWGTAPLTLINSCSPCTGDCATCSTSSNTCVLCSDTNSSPSTSTGTGCICNNGYWNTNAAGSTVSCSQCNSECLTCAAADSCITCIDPHAMPDVSGTGCSCISGYTGEHPLTTTSSCVLCAAECASCTSVSACASCVDPNASPSADASSLCSCNAYYWGVPPLISSSSCSACNTDCSTCSNSQSCVTCRDANASPSMGSLGGCLCNARFYNSNTASTPVICIPCNSECLSCSNSIECAVCIDPNASPNLNTGVGCECKSGYGGVAPLNTAESCTPCISDCSTCSQSTTCLTCTDPNSSPNSATLVGCLCKPGYFSASESPLVCQECFVECSTCSAPSVCSTCVALNSSPLESGGCACNFGFFNITALVSALDCHVTGAYCDPSCLTCSGPYNYQCTSCSNVYLNGYCVSNCPVGNIVLEQNCTGGTAAAAAADFKFEGAGTVFKDNNNILTGYIVSLNRRSLQNATAGPASVYGRGLYFPGNGYLKINSTTERIFGSKFVISVWINPSSSSCAFFYKDYSIFSLSLQSLYPVLTLNINGTSFSFTSTIPLVQSDWNQVLLSVNFSLSVTTLSLTINTNSVPSQSLSSIPFLDSANTSLLVGYSPSLPTLYTGFLYELALYTTAPTISTLVSSSCEACNLCPAGGSCIISCNATSYYSNTTNQCLQCPSSCTSGCLDSNTCGLCADQHCVSCSSYSANSCTLCDPGYVVQNSLCVACNSTSYYDASTFSCIQCQGLCSSCNSDIVCITCMPHSALASDYSCQCILGYAGIACNRNLFNATLMVSQDNVVTLLFSEPLYTSLLQNNLNITVNSTAVTFSINETSPSEYKIGLDIIYVVTANTKVLVQFVGEITSVNNSLLSTASLSSQLFTSDAAATAQATKVKAAAAKATAKAASTAGVAASLGISLLNFNPASIFHFINTAEILYYAYLFGVDMPPVLSEFLIGLRNGVLSGFPNVYAHLIDSSMGVPLNSKLTAYGYNSNLMILNAGQYVTILSIALCILLICILVGFNSWGKIRLRRIIKYFRFGFFLRFWIQTFLEIFTCCCIGIKYSKFQNTTQVIDYLFCILFIVRYI